MSSRSTPEPITRAATVDGARDPYDHAINLIDTTVEPNSDSPQLAESSSWRDLARRATQTSVREQLARRKYAKWQQDRYDNDDDVGAATSDRENASGGETRLGRPVTHHANSESQAVDFAHAETDPANVVKPKSQKKKKSHRRHHDEVSEIDILFENQRGSFFCGIPLYSHSSLLNFDPSAWVTRDYKDSAVNITNAQVPDPSWIWTWKSWYVDMSGDVDEEGWQYSFMFGNRFAWHGTHPWFHSFVRRRMWIRKRVKRPDLVMSKEKDGSMGAAHHLTADYFTIHSKQREASPGSARESLSARPQSFTSHQSTSVTEEPPDEIKDVASLMKALRQATIDRERIDAVKEFIKDGGDELFYLEEQIPDIMSFLVFQTSKRQLLEFLKQSANEAEAHRQEHEAEDKPEGEAEKRRTDNLIRAVNAANSGIKGLEFWSDRKHVLQTTDETGKSKDESFRNTFDTPADMPKADANPASGIVGIPAAAEIKMSPMRSVRSQKKGKQKEESEWEEVPKQDSKIERDGKPHLGSDAVLVPDDEEAG